MSTSVVKVLEMEVIGVTATGPVELSLGLASQPDEAASIRLDAVPADSDAASAGRVRLALQDGTSEGERTLFAAGSAGTHRPTDSGTVIEDLDLAVIVDSEKKMAEAHLGYSYVSCGPEGFPVGQVLTPMVKAVLLADGEASVKVRRVIIGTYT